MSSSPSSSHGVPGGALQGLRVLDLSRVLAGPLAGQILADLGADVIKVERPGRGDDCREWAPPYMTQEPAEALNESVYFWSCNRGKRSVTIDLAGKFGQEAVRQLAAKADILLENYKVGTLSRYGLDYATLSALNPRLVYCSITAFGQTGPYRERPGYDTIVQALGGVMSITGNPDGEPGGGPRKTGIAAADLMTGLYAVVAILAAVNERHRSGLGQYIDMALLDVQVAALAYLGVGYLATGRIPKRSGNRSATVYPSDTFRCSDGGYVMVIVGNDEQFRSFSRAMGIEGVSDDPRFLHNEDRLKNGDLLEPLVAEAFSRRTVADCQRILDAAGVPASPINDIAQVFTNPQVVAREMVCDVERLDGRKAKLIANPIRMSRTPPLHSRLPPMLGEHTEEVLGGAWSAS